MSPPFIIVHYSDNLFNDKLNKDPKMEVIFQPDINPFLTSNIKLYEYSFYALFLSFYLTVKSQSFIYSIYFSNNPSSSEVKP